MKWIICTFILFFSLGLRAQQSIPPSPFEDTLKVPSQEQPSQIPDAENTKLDNPAVAMTLTVDFVTLPKPVCPLRPNELAHSIARFNQAIDVYPGVLAQN
jgi:hypothetical protein